MKIFFFPKTAQPSLTAVHNLSSHSIVMMTNLHSNDSLHILRYWRLLTVDEESRTRTYYPESGFLIDIHVCIYSIFIVYICVLYICAIQHRWVTRMSSMISWIVWAIHQLWSIPKPYILEIRSWFLLESFSCIHPTLTKLRYFWNNYQNWD